MSLWQSTLFHFRCSSEKSTHTLGSWKQNIMLILIFFLFYVLEQYSHLHCLFTAIFESRSWKTKQPEQTFRDTFWSMGQVKVTVRNDDDGAENCNRCLNAGFFTQKYFKDLSEGDTLLLSVFCCFSLTIFPNLLAFLST